MHDLTIESFQNQTGSTFRIEEADLTVELSEVGESVPGAFSVLFHGPPEPVLAQATYTFSQPDGAPQPIFIVPIGRAESGAVVYEAVFTAGPPG